MSGSSARLNPDASHSCCSSRGQAGSGSVTRNELGPSGSNGAAAYSPASARVCEPTEGPTSQTASSTGTSPVRAVQSITSVTRARASASTCSPVAG
nr:hypothetical protein [Herbihabitans rhizosphaerae]